MHHRKAQEKGSIFLLYYSPSTCFLFATRLNLNILLLSFKAVNALAHLLAYLSKILDSHTSPRALRSSDQLLLEVPKSKFKTRVDWTFESSCLKPLEQLATPNKDLPPLFIVLNHHRRLISFLWPCSQLIMLYHNRFYYYFFYYYLYCFTILFIIVL